MPHPNATDPRSIFLSRNDNQRLGIGLATPNALLQTADIGLIYLDSASQPVPAWAHHSAPQFVQPSPSGLVAFESQHALETHGARPILLAGHPPGCPEPERQGHPCVLENRPCRHRTLVVAGRALQKDFGFRPALPPTTARATEPVGPAEPKQVFPAGPLRREASLKLQQIPRIILHRRSYYSL